MKRTRELPHRARWRLALAVPAALLAAGCSVTSPATVIEPYPPSDGVQVDIRDPADGSALKLRNFLVVASADGKRGQVIGAVVNTGSSQVQLQLAATSSSSTGAPVQVEVPAAGLTQIGPSGTPVVLDQISAPGTFLEMTAGTSAGGTQSFSVPVVPATGDYAALAPSAAAVPSATP